MTQLSGEDYRDDAVLSLLERIGSIVTSPLEIDKVLSRFLAELTSGLGVGACWIQLLNPDKEELALIAHQGFTKEMVREMGLLKLNQSLSSQVLSSGKPLTTADISSDTNNVMVAPVKAGFHSSAVVPLKTDDKVLGVMGLYSTALDRFRNYEIRLVSVISTYVAMVIDRELSLSQKDKLGKAEFYSTMSERQDFLNMLSHELQTPLTALVASAGLLEDELQRKPKDTQTRLIQNILHSASSLQDRLAELLQLFQSEITGMPP